MRGIVIALGMLAVGITLLILTISSIGPANIARVFEQFSIPVAAAFLGLALTTHALAAYRWQRILRVLGHRLHFTELFQYVTIGYGVGYIAPLGRTGSVPTRILLIKRRGVRYLRGITSILMDSTLENSFDVMFGIIMLSAFLLITRSPLLVPFAAGAAIVIAFIVFFYARMLSRKPFFNVIARIIPRGISRSLRWNMARTSEIDTSFSHFLRTQPLEICRIFAISVITWLILLLQYNLALAAIGQHVTLLQLVIILVTLSLAAITPVPAGVGVLELSQAAIFSSLGLDPTIGVAFAILIRFRDFFITILGASFLFHIGVRILTSNDR